MPDPAPPYARDDGVSLSKMAERPRMSSGPKAARRTTSVGRERLGAVLDQRDDAGARRLDAEERDPEVEHPPQPDGAAGVARAAVLEEDEGEAEEPHRRAARPACDVQRVRRRRRQQALGAARVAVGGEQHAYSVTRSAQQSACRPQRRVPTSAAPRASLRRMDAPRRRHA